ncbi:peptidase S41 [Gymnodinialimonas ulvae]|uniref:peptidase S41 n=1 Tax=Gymnodinialimonas ulvae TaxID=3126504 RepID=UPI0030AF8866
MSIASSVHLVFAAPDITASTGALVAVNGTPVRQIESAAGRFLAGTPQRKRVIGSILLAWPYALAQLGFPSKGGATEYRLQDADGQIIDLKVDHENTALASTLYPRSEHGRADPAWEPGTFVKIITGTGIGLSIALPSFFDPGETALAKAISNAAEQVTAHAHSPLLIDVRGNTGGDFLKTMPLIDAIAGSARRQVVVLVDKFTFSAAIVFVAILKHRLGDRLRILGEDMGDGLAFFAEGGLLDLPASRAAVRYSSAFHDWKTGCIDETTPPEIAHHIVAVGSLDLDGPCIAEPTVAKADGDLYRHILTRLTS